MAKYRVSFGDGEKPTEDRITINILERNNEVILEAEEIQDWSGWYPLLYVFYPKENKLRKEEPVYDDDTWEPCSENDNINEFREIDVDQDEYREVIEALNDMITTGDYDVII